MDFVIFVAFISTIWLLWSRGTDKLKADGRGWLFRNFVAASISISVGVLQLVLMIGEFGFSTFVGAAILVGSIWLFRQPLPGKPANFPAAVVNYVASPIAEAVYANEPGPEDPLAKWKDSAPPSPARYGLVADIEFDYRDARGNDSHRHVNVEAVDREYLQGHCHKASDTRTFVIGRVRGKVLDLETGEVLAPKAWAAEARKHPLNDPSLISLGNDDEDDDEEIAVDDAGRVEICFTGFSKADRLRLEELAKLLDMQVRQSVTQGLTHLCTGKNAGPKKLEQAAEVGAEIIDEADFYVLNTRS